MDFASLLPEIKPWVRSLSTAWPVPLIKSSSWAFPAIICSHVLAMTVVGGATLLPNLRLMGVGMTQQTPAQIEKTMRPWLIGALVVMVVTGVLMSMVNPLRMYTRPAFFIKMIALVAALILSLGAVRSIASHDGAVTRPAKILFGVGLAVWLAAVVIFGTSFGAAPGMVHVIFAAWLIVMVFGSRLTRHLLGGVTALTVLVVGVVTYGLFPPLANYDTFMDINRWTLRVGAVVIAGFLLWEFGRARPTEVATTPLNRLVGVFTILAWFTVAAAGRWIGLGTAG